MSLAKMAKWLPQEYFILAKEYLGESGRGRKLQGAGTVNAIVTIAVGRDLALKEEKGKTNTEKGKDAKAVGVGAGDTAGESRKKKVPPAPAPMNAAGCGGGGGSASKKMKHVKKAASHKYFFLTI